MGYFRQQDDFADAIKGMIQYDLKGRGIKDEQILRIMSQIPRENFIPEKYKSQAYFDGPLPIDCNQTISQPYIVALMTEQLRVNPDSEVLEIGTGSGYQTAVLCGLAKKVYTIERFEELSLSAQKILEKLNISNVEFFIGDGSKGWPLKRDFDRIIITAAVPQIPEPLTEQLKQDGLIVAPVGGSAAQRLIVFRKKHTQLIESFVCDVRFVRLVGEYACGQ
ncbi:MAG: protein-L-isoaspartate(D-aspartate) O-methyltransferase [Phycisphaerae bacterium]